MSFYEHKTNTEEQVLKRFLHDNNILVAKYEAQITQIVWLHKSLWKHVKLEA